MRCPLFVSCKCNVPHICKSLLHRIHAQPTPMSDSPIQQSNLSENCKDVSLGEIIVQNVHKEVRVHNVVNDFSRFSAFLVYRCPLCTP
mmetsp:Transcript_5078/g.19033  ORF Transcript_5078/g.19033 Transcript_5078/m.19033 type:complete len:88 (+) Transcript_5078:493-756(+)